MFSFSGGMRIESERQADAGEYTGWNRKSAAMGYTTNQAQN
jgi:hypothetical protein